VEDIFSMLAPLPQLTMRTRPDAKEKLVVVSGGRMAFPLSRISPSSLWLLSSVVQKYLETLESVVLFLQTRPVLYTPPSTLWLCCTYFLAVKR
jgi:hypothetical protein